MKNVSTIVLGIALASVGGLFGANVSGLLFTADSESSIESSAMFTGHVITTVKDADGNVKHYRQSDNLVLNNGENCASKALFGIGGPTSTGSAAVRCSGALTEGFNWIAVGNGTVTVDAEAGTIDGEIADNGLSRVQGTVTLTNSTTAGAGGGGAQAKIENTFTWTGGQTNTVNNSGLFNGTVSATDGIFAQQGFTGIPLDNGDSLTVEWTINVGGGTVTP